MRTKLACICLLFVCFTGCSFQPSLMSEKRIINQIQENTPNTTHVETVHESNPQSPDETTGMNVYYFTNGEFDFRVYNYLSYYFGSKNNANQVYIEYDTALLKHLEPQIKTILSDCGFTYQLDERTGHDKMHNTAVLIINNTFTSDNPYLRFYTNQHRVDDEMLPRIQDAVAKIATLLEPYLVDDINLPDVISFPVSIHTTEPTSLNSALFHSSISLSKKDFKKDIETWSELTVQKANR